MTDPKFVRNLASARERRRPATTKHPALLRMPVASSDDVTALLPRRPDLFGAQPVVLRRPDVVFLGTWFLALQFLIPARLVFGGLGAAGRPSLALALGIGVLWVAGFFQRGSLDRSYQPVRWFVGAYVLVQVASYAAGYDRGLPGVEARSADRWLIATFALAGLTMALSDGLRTRQQIDLVLGRLVALTSVMGVVGIIQAVASVDLTRYIRIPGLQLNSELIGVSTRGTAEVARVAGTANHYIEFGVVLGAVLPIALHRALHAPAGAPRQWRWIAAVIIAAGVPLSISRSGILAMGIALAVLSVVWPWRFRAQALVVGLIGAVVFRLVQPGVLGTLQSLFRRAEDDPSVQNRIADYAYVEDLFPERPWLGRGVGTLLPDRYILLDNQYLNTLLSSGAFGLVAFTGLFVGAYLMARSVRLRGADAETRHLGQALAASIAAMAVCSATFDSLSFATYTGVLFFMIGVTAALWRVDDGPRSRRPLQPSWPGDRYVASPWMANRPGLAHLYARTEGWGR